MPHIDQDRQQQPQEHNFIRMLIDEAKRNNEAKRQAQQNEQSDSAFDQAHQAIC